MSEFNLSRRGFLGVAGVVSGSVFLGGCSSSGGNGGDLSGSLTFATYQWLEKGRGDIIFDAVNKYSSFNSKATLTKQEITRAEYEKTLSTQIGAGAGPDIFVVPDTYFFELAESGALEPLDDVLGSEDAGRLTNAGETYLVDGQRLALPWETAPFAFFWNKDIFKEAGLSEPKSFEEVMSAAKTIREKTGKIGFATRHQMNEEAPWWLDHFLWPLGFGGGWSDGQKLTINSDANVKAEIAYKELYDSGAFAVGDDASTYRAKFGQGQIGMMFDNAGPMRALTLNNTVVPASSVGGASIPLPSGVGTYVGVGIGINANSKNKALAKDFLKWLFTKDTQTSVSEGLFPSTVGTAVDVPKHLIDENPWWVGVHEGLSKAKPTLVPGFETETPQIRTIILSQVSRILTQNADPRQALDLAQQQALQVVGKK